MKKFLKFMCLPFVLLAVGCKSGNNEAKEGYTKVVDLLDREVYVPDDADEFICVGPGALRQFCYIADLDTLVGIENYEKISSPATRPYAHKLKDYLDLPTIGEGGKEDKTNYEAVRRCKPDVIFTTYISDKKDVENLEKSTHIPVVALNYNANGLFAEDCYESFRLIGKVTHNETRAKEVVDYFMDCKNELVEKASVKPSSEKAYIGALNRKGSHGIRYTTPDYTTFDILKVHNAAKDMNIDTYAEVNIEKIRVADPDVIFIDAGGLEKVKKEMNDMTLSLQNLTAFKNHRVFLQMPYTYYHNNLEVALANAYFTASIIYPEQFPDLDMSVKFNTITQKLLGVDAYDAIATRFKCNYGSFFDYID